MEDRLYCVQKGDSFLNERVEHPSLKLAIEPYFSAKTCKTVAICLLRLLIFIRTSEENFHLEAEALAALQDGAEEIEKTR